MNGDEFRARVAATRLRGRPLLPRRRCSIAIVLMVAAASHAAQGETIQTFGEGSAVTSIDRSATFDNLNFAGNQTPLSNYRTGLLKVFTNGNSYYGDNAVGQIGIDGVVSSGSVYFNPFHITNGPGYSYANAGGGFYFPYDGDWGNTDWITIQTTDAKKIYAVEFLYGNGWTTGDIYGTYTGYPWGNSNAYLDWQTLVGGNVVSSGQVGLSEYLGVGTVVGFSDPNGFSQLRIRAPDVYSLNPSVLQELAIDNLNVQITPLPEPAAATLWVTGLACLWYVVPRRAFRKALFVAAACLGPAWSATAATVTFDLDSGTPTPAAQSTATPFNITIDGLTAHFSSPQDGGPLHPAFSLQNQNTTFYNQILLTGNYLWPDSVFKNVLDIKFSQPLSSIAFDFATVELPDPAEFPSNLRLVAYNNSMGSTPIGSAQAAGVYGSTTYPEGMLSFSSNSTFNLVEIQVGANSFGTTNFLSDNFTVVAVPEPGAFALAVAALLSFAAWVGANSGAFVGLKK